MFLFTKHILDATPLPGFLTGAYAKMEAQSKMVDYAKHNSPNLQLIMGVLLCVHRLDKILP